MGSLRDWRRNWNGFREAISKLNSLGPVVHVLWANKRKHFTLISLRNFHASKCFHSEILKNFIKRSWSIQHDKSQHQIKKSILEIFGLLRTAFQIHLDLVEGKFFTKAVFTLLNFLMNFLLAVLLLLFTGAYQLFFWINFGESENKNERLSSN
jgi:hypothetical protein